MFRQIRLACSFCGKGKADVAKLVEGPKVYICDQCVVLASQIIEGTLRDKPQPPESQRGYLRRVLDRIGWLRHRDLSSPSEGHSVAR